LSVAAFAGIDDKGAGDGIFAKVMGNNGNLIKNEREISIRKKSTNLASSTSGTVSSFVAAVFSRPKPVRLISFGSPACAKRSTRPLVITASGLALSP
jgi:hypothetical protein